MNPFIIDRIIVMSFDFTFSEKRGSVESPYMHLICSPMVNPQLWASLYQYLLQLPSRDFPTITQALERFALSHPLLLGSIREFGKFKCAPNPACKLPQSDDRFCSPGVRTQVFGKHQAQISSSFLILETLF